MLYFSKIVTLSLLRYSSILSTTLQQERSRGMLNHEMDDDDFSDYVGFFSFHHNSFFFFIILLFTTAVVFYFLGEAMLPSCCGLIRGVLPKPCVNSKMEKIVGGDAGGSSFFFRGGSRNKANLFWYSVLFCPSLTQKGPDRLPLTSL